MKIENSGQIHQMNSSLPVNVDRKPYIAPSFESTLASNKMRCIYDFFIGSIVRFFKWLFCFKGKEGENNRSLTFQSQKNLERVEIPQEVPNIKGMDTRKKIWFNEALSHFHKKGLQSNYQVHSQDNHPFLQGPNKTPPYFLKQLSNTREAYSCTGEYFDYNPIDKENKYEVWVDFANRKLLGGALSLGAVQEELMAAEIPELLMHGMTHLEPNRLHSIVETRSGNGGVLEGSPTPLLFEGLWRVQKVDSRKVYGHNFRKNVTEDNAKEFIRQLAQPQKVNILAMAAPCLRRRTPSEQTDFHTLSDLFNTFVAGFTLVKEQAEKIGKKGLVHTGKIGAGAFGNNPSVVFALQRLAADFVGVEVRFYDYDRDATSNGNRLYEALNAQLSSETTIQGMLQTASTRFREILMGQSSWSSFLKYFKG